MAGDEAGSDDAELSCMAAQRLEDVYSTFALPSGNGTAGGMNVHELSFALKSICGELAGWMPGWHSECQLSLIK
jgi:hypothetical protein